MHRVWLHFNCRHKNRRETRRLPPFLPSFLLALSFISVFPLCDLQPVTDYCLCTGERGKVGRWVFKGQIWWQSVCVIVIRALLSTLICSMRVWLNACLCVIALALSNGGSLLTKLSSEHKTNWSRNQPASPDLRAVKERIRSLIDVWEQLVYKLRLRAEQTVEL